MTLDEAKRIVLEKYPNAYRIKTFYDGYVIHKNQTSARMSNRLGDICSTEEGAWLSAARRIQKEKDK